MIGDDETANEYASPACFMHEVDPAYMGLAPAFDPREQRDVQRWRKPERERLIMERLAVDAETRTLHARRIAERLDAVIGALAGRIVSAYWPFRGEPDLRDWLGHVSSRGGRTALPIVVEKHKPLIFRTWKNGERLEKGVWNIPVPIDGEEVCPDIVIAPLVGYDKAGFRLGYGGGFFDRTLAAMPKKPLVIGVGYAQAAIATIYPQPYDIPMDRIVTETETIVHSQEEP